MNKNQTIILATLSSCAVVATAVITGAIIKTKKNKDNLKTNLQIQSDNGLNCNIEVQDLFTENRLKYMKDYFEKTMPEKVLPLLKRDAAYSELSGDTLIIGDLHGKLSSLEYCKNKAMEYLEKGKNVLFLGDLVDNHPERKEKSGANSDDDANYDASAECFLFAMMLKEKYPDRVIILRGNHETSLRNCPYSGVGKSMPQWCKDNSVDLKKFKECCDELPIACKISIGDKSYFCVHGGICEGLNPEEYKKFKFIERSEDFYKAISTPELQSLWNDAADNDEKTPWEPDPERKPFQEPYRRYFNKAQTEEFLKRVNCDKIIRGHDFHGGKASMQDGLVVTIMSESEIYKNPEGSENPDASKNPYDFKSRRIGYLTADRGVEAVYFGKYGEVVEPIQN